MKFKKLKYNLICCILVLFIASVVVLKVYFFDENIPDSEITSPSNPDNNPSPENPDVDPSEPNIPVDDTRDPNLPPAQFPTAIVNYSLNKLRKSNGYNSSLNFSTVLTGSFQGVSIKTLNSVDGYMQASAEKRVESVKFTSDDLSSIYFDKRYLQTL